MDTTELRAQLAKLHSSSFGWALSCCDGDRPMAEDVLQSAYLKLLDERAQFGERSSFQTWLFGVIRNSAREERRRMLLRRACLLRYEPERAEPQDNPAAEMVAKESNIRIRAALEKLSRRQREVLHLVFYQDLTIEEASRVMAVPIGTARKHYQRGKIQMRKHLKEDTDER